MLWIPALMVLAQTATLPVEVHARFERSGERLVLRYCSSSPGHVRLRSSNAQRPTLLAIDPVPDRDTGDLLEWHLARPGCVELHHALGRIADARREGRGWRIGDNLLSYARTWWWQPDAQAQTWVQFELPAGWLVSAPWPTCAGAADCRIVPALPDDQPAFVALGPFPLRVITAGSARIETAVVGAVEPQQLEPLFGLGPRAVALITQAHGLMPTPRLQIVVVPWRHATQAIVFGQINRGGLGGMQLFVDPAASTAALDADWVLPHELAHLLHPYLGGARGRWLAEGLASYYQNVLRARAGLLTPEAAWQRMFEGFERGRAVAGSAPLDAMASARGGTMRMYWAGAAFWLAADLALRQRGDPGLDDVLRRFGARHLPATHDWQPAQFLDALDAQLLADGRAALFRETADAAGATHDFPPLAPLAAALGGRWDGRHWSAPDPGPGAPASAIMVPRPKPDPR